MEIPFVGIPEVTTLTLNVVGETDCIDLDDGCSVELKTITIAISLCLKLHSSLPQQRFKNYFWSDR